MIKLWADSLDKSFEQPNESFLFVKDLIKYGDGFEQAVSYKDADVIVIPQYSNNHINNSIGNYVFDRDKANLYFGSLKLIVIINTGGGCPCEWEKFPIYEYIKNGVAKRTVIFSTECYSWHRNFLPRNVVYLPYEYMGFTNFGLGLRSIPPLQSKEHFLSRELDTAVAINNYPPTRDRLWELIQENLWNHFSYQTIPNGNQQRVEWEVMTKHLFNSKIGFSPDGATAKTERHVYMPSYTVMMKQEDAYLEFPYKWVDGENCIEMVHDFMDGLNIEKELSYEQNGHHLRVLNKEKTKEKILYYLSQPDKLYEIYVNGWYNDENYRIPKYNKSYISQSIKNNL